MANWIAAACLTGLGLLGQWLYGNRDRRAPVLMLCVLAGWIIYNIANEQWALIVFPTALNVVVTIRNLHTMHHTAVPGPGTVAGARVPGAAGGSGGGGDGDGNLT